MIVAGTGLGLSWGDLNPVNWAKAVGGAVGSVGKVAGGAAGSLLQKKETWALGIAAAGTAFGIPPSVSMPIALAVAKGGAIPPGTDPRLVALMQQNAPPKDYTPWIIGGGVGLVLLALLLRK